jgi:hypothetical protein
MYDAGKFNWRLRERYIGNPRIKDGLYGLDPLNLILLHNRTHVPYNLLSCYMGGHHSIIVSQKYLLIYVHSNIRGLQFDDNSL